MVWRLIIVSAVFLILAFDTYAQELYSKSFGSSSTNGQRVSYLPSYTIYNDDPLRNSEGIYYDSLFSFSSLENTHMFSQSLKITNNATKEIIFERVSQYYDLAFEDQETGALVLVSSLGMSDFSLLILSEEGEVLAEHSLSYNLFDKFVKVLENENKGLFGPQGMSDEDFASDRSYSASEDNGSQDGEEAEDEQVIILACGRIKPYVEQIKSLVVDRFGMIEGFEFISKDKHRTFLLKDLRDFLNQQTTILVNVVEEKFAMECYSGEIENVAIDGRYMRKCSDGASAFVELWELLPADTEEPLKNQGFELLMNSEVYRVAYGKLYKGQKTDIWMRIEEELDGFETCNYRSDKLEEKCIGRWQEDQWITSFRNGFTHGISQEYYEGSLEESCEYYAGYKNGRCLVLNDGVIEEECTYYGESRKGICTERFVNSDIIASECEMLGKMYHGQCSYFNKDGTLRETALFEFDDLVWSQTH